MRGDTLLERSYYPLAVAADLAGYHPRTVQKLVAQGKVRSRLRHRRREVHLGSLLAYRKLATPPPSPLHTWLLSQTAIKRQVLTYKELAILASADLGQHVTERQIYCALFRVRFPPDNAKK